MHENKFPHSVESAKHWHQPSLAVCLRALIAYQKWQSKLCFSSDLFRADRQGGKWPPVLLGAQEDGCSNANKRSFTKVASGSVLLNSSPLAYYKSYWFLHNSNSCKRESSIESILAHLAGRVFQFDRWLYDDSQLYRAGRFFRVS